MLVAGVVECPLNAASSCGVGNRTGDQKALVAVKVAKSNFDFWRSRGVRLWLKTSGKAILQLLKCTTLSEFVWFLGGQMAIYSLIPEHRFTCNLQGTRPRESEGASGFYSGRSERECQALAKDEGRSLSFKSVASGTQYPSIALMQWAKSCCTRHRTPLGSSLLQMVQI